MLWIQQPMTPQDRWRLVVDAAYSVEAGIFVSGVTVFDEAGALCGSLTHVSAHGTHVADLAVWLAERLDEVHDALTPTFPSAST
jgi:hypothetical protein